MAVSKAQQKAVNKYMAANYDRINLTVPKGKKEAIQAHATAQGESVNGFINRAINEAIGQDRDKASSGAVEARPDVGGISLLPPDVVKVAKEAAGRTGEAPVTFIARAIETQAKRDKSSIALGINPATGDKTDEGGADHE